MAAGLRPHQRHLHWQPRPAILALEYELQGNLQERDSVSYGFDFGNRPADGARQLTLRLRRLGRRLELHRTGLRLSKSELLLPGLRAELRDNKKIRTSILL